MDRTEAEIKLHKARNALMDQWHPQSQRVAEFERTVEVFTRMTFMVEPSAHLMVPYLSALAEWQSIPK